jgi:regulation of enolase protein 1 (concanavalin A-like superfamily)
MIGLAIGRKRTNRPRAFAQMNAAARLSAALLLLGVAPGRAADATFADDFQGKLGAGWSWVREHRQAWRVTDRGLEVRIEPGNMWGPANDAKNVLLRPAPIAADGEIEVSVTVENRPTSQYEQVDLVWYFDDGHMVKLGQELVDGKLSIVMGREESDKTRTVAIIPLRSFSVQLRLAVKGNRIRGQFRPAGFEQWRDAGECDLPAVTDGQAKISLQFYQGPAKVEHWARVTEFRIRRLPN